LTELAICALATACGADRLSMGLGVGAALKRGLRDVGSVGCANPDDACGLHPNHAALEKAAPQ